MALRAATLILLSVLHVCSPADPDPLRRPVGWFQKCRSTAPSLTALEVLPGGGWDNLRNLDMGRVMNFGYEQCQTTEDGFYFVPDDVFVVPWKVTNVDIYAEVFTSWLDHKSSTSGSINVGGSAKGEDGALNGRFSAEHQRVKTNQVNDQSSTTRVQVRNRIYTAKANPDFRLDPLFVQQVDNIAAAIKNNQAHLATYLSEKLVADYGTHVITSVDAGAALVKEDYVKSSYISSSNTSMTSVKASAGYSFFGLFSVDIDVSYNHNSSEQSQYNSSITNSFMEGYGGLPYYPGMSLKEWQDSTRNNLVAIDRSGLPLHYVINTNTLPHLTEPNVSKVAFSVQQAVQRYYGVNTHRGCVDYNSPHFNFTANVDDGSCSANHSLGGVFRTCDGPGELCEQLEVNQTNPDTGDYTCRPPYQQILLSTVAWIGGAKPFSLMMNITTRWCYSSAPIENRGFLFGGFCRFYAGSITKDSTALATHCPLYFTAFRFLFHNNPDAPGPGIYICLSSDYELAAGRALPFGGFFSCFSANPLTGRRDCPSMFRPELLTDELGCPVYYCVMSGQVRGEQPLSARLPPFTARPHAGPHARPHARPHVGDDLFGERTGLGDDVSDEEEWLEEERDSGSRHRAWDDL